MKRLSILITSLCCCLTSPLLMANNPLVIATGEYSPFVSKNLKHQGYVSHIISRAFELEGYTVTYKYFPWKRAYESTKKGEFDATSFWYQSDERKQDFIYSYAVNTEKTVFFYRKDKPLKDWNTMADLEGFKIGATIGYTYTKDFWAAAKEGVINVSETAKDAANMKKLVSARIDLFPAGIVLGNTLLHKNFAASMVSTIDYTTKPLVATTGHLLFPKVNPNSKQLVTIFNRGLQKLNKSGELEKMFDMLITGKYDK
ncbi:hypothetical protein A9Q99_14850 [Gammaproteobacteria bacterium 45_16_T64]|nr:hypothetical protein A9Q99_14850 [Gammaproteobacteria bacterium 45_16_T64]